MRPDIGHTYFRSSWEANYARVLNWQLARGEIAAWEYEPVAFVLEGSTRGARTYRPDFWVKLQHAGAMAADKQGEIDALTGTMASEWMAFKAKRKADKAALVELQDDHKQLCAEVREQAHTMLVPVRIEHDFGLGASRFYRLDRGPVAEDGTRSGELYDTRPMDPEERAKLRAEAPPIIEPPPPGERVTVPEATS